MTSTALTLTHRVTASLVAGSMLAWSMSAWPQSITATLNTGGGPGLAINRVTDQIYVGGSPVDIVDGKTNVVTSLPVNGSAVAVNEATNKIYVLSGNSVTVVDGVTNAATVITDPNANGPCSLAVNPSTNRIYVTNCQSANVTVIDGATNATTTVTDANARGLYAAAVAVNAVTNKIYVANSLGNKPGNVTVIDGATNSITTVTDPNAIAPNSVAVNPVTNRIYVANYGNYPSGGTNSGNITVIDGSTNAVTTLTDPNASVPFAVAVDSTTNRIYVANANSNNVTAIDGATHSLTTITDPNAQAPIALAVDEVRGRVYVANFGGGGNEGSNPGSVTIIDEASRSTTTIIDANFTGHPNLNAAPGAVVSDSQSDQVYVVNLAGTADAYGTLIVIGGDVIPSTHTLGVLLAGTGLGAAMVSSSPAGIGADAYASFPAGTEVTVTATSSYSGIAFAGWSGPCSGTGACVLTANSDQFVTATFAPAVSVPSVAADTQAAAVAAITAVGLVVGTVTQQSSDTVPSGSVISESPAAGTNVAVGSAIKLMVSSGPPVSSGGGGGGGGGGIDLLTLGALLGSLVVGLGRGSVRSRPPTETPITHIHRRTHGNTKKIFSAGLVSLAILVPFPLAAQEPGHPGAPIRYSVKVLGSLGGTNCCLVITNNDRGWVDFTSNLSGDQNFHPVLWRNGQLIDLGTLGGPNASVGGMNDLGDVTVGGADTGIPDPLGEDACSFGTYQTCLSYLWHQGKRTPVPTLGGNNGDVSTINNRGNVLGFAESAYPDPTCLEHQVLGYRAFIWQPRTGDIHVLPPLAADSDSAAFDLNDRGQAVGFSGTCGIGLADFTAAQHAVVWQDGKPTDLGNFGGTAYNVALGINNQGDAVGISAFPGTTVGHAFLWTNGHMTDLGTLPGDVISLGNRISDERVVAVQSCDANLNCRAAIWRDGVMTDLNTLIPSNSHLFLEVAASINSRGEIVGNALDLDSGATVPFLATPCDRRAADGADCAEAANDASAMRAHGSRVNGENPKPHPRGRSAFRGAHPG